MSAKTKLLISRAMVWSKIEDLRSEKPKQFSATFIKKDGTVREMIAMVGVKAGVSGKGMRWNPADRGMISVHECQNPNQKDLPPEDKKRLINVMTLLTIKIEGEEYQVVDSFTNEQIEKANQSILEARKLAKMRKELKTLNIEPAEMTA